MNEITILQQWLALHCGSWRSPHITM